MLQYQLPENVMLTAEAERRLQQRGIPRHHVAYALVHGQYRRRGDITEVWLHRRRIARHDLAAMDKAAGLMLIFAHETRTIITAFHTDHRLKQRKHPARSGPLARSHRLYRGRG